MGKTSEKLLKLVRENPGLDVIPMVYDDVVEDDGYRIWEGKWLDAHIERIYRPKGYHRFLEEGRIYIESQDEEEILETMYDRLEAVYPDWSHEYISDTADKEYSGIDWEEVIVVYIGGY